MKRKSFGKAFVFGVVLMFVAASFVFAQEEQGFDEVSDTILVVGTKLDSGEFIGGAAHYIDAESFRSRGYDDINRALRAEPGIQLREEDGYGLFPNIGVRGVDSQRTSKLTVMEDGIPTAPAPYSAPSAYYTPTVGRMAAIEILKGSSQIQYGPHTTGGVINYISTPALAETQGYVNISHGSNNDFRLHSYGGTSKQSSLGVVGVLGEVYLRDTDGFKTIKSGEVTVNTFIDDDTGFKRLEGMAKVFWEPDTTWYQRLELKVGHTTLDANETYLGITDADFDENPYQRYFASFRDNIYTEQWRSYLRWTATPTENLKVAATVFYNNFNRNWYKYHGGSHLSDERLTKLKGDGTEDLKYEYRNNRRFYDSKGVEAKAEYTARTGGVEHNLRGGIRYMSDYIRRDQNDHAYNVNAVNGTLTVTDDGRCSGACRKQESRAVAFFVADEMKYGRFTLAPGLRYEHVRQEARRYGVDPDTGNLVLQDRDGGINGKDHYEGSISAFTSGISAGFKATEGLNIFAGVHRGVALPSPSGHLRSGLSEETSIATEVGARWSPAPFAYLNATFFHTKFDDLLVHDNIGSTGSGGDESVGEVVSTGLEIQTGADLGNWLGWSLSNPWYLAMTFTRAELEGDINSEDVESIFFGGTDGSNVPYIPNYQISFGTGVKWNRFGFFVDVYLVDETYSTASNEDAPPTQDSDGMPCVNATGGTDPAGVCDYRIGKTDSYGIVDLSASVELTDTLTLTGNIHNLFDKAYIVSRHPIGPRPGLPREFRIGLTADL